MEKIQCSVPLLTLNSKQTLERALPMLAETFDDVFIVDGNSTDGTQEYARSLGVRVEKQFDTDEPNQRIKNFRETRMKSWTMCKYDWLFVLDADETPMSELIELIRRIVEGDDKRTVHLVMRHIQLPDGRIIRHSPFYASHYVRIFSLGSGVTLADRKVHERFLIPEGLRIAEHEEAIICPEPTAEGIRKRNLRYLELEAEQLTNTSRLYFWKWIVCFNVKSFIGQCVRVIRERITNLFRKEPSLPWAYNYVFLRYRFDSLFWNARAWYRKRRSERNVS